MWAHVRGRFWLRPCVNDRETRGTRSARSWTRRELRFRRRRLWPLINSPRDDWRLIESGVRNSRVRRVGPRGSFRTRWRPVRIVRRNGHRTGQGDALRFSEERNKNDRRENGSLRGDGNDQGATTNAALTRALFWRAFDETALQGTKLVLRTWVGTGAGFDRHHTPPQKSSASENRTFCDAGFLWVAQKPQETGAALAVM